MNRKTSKNKIKNNSKKKRTIKRIRREKEKEKEVEKKEAHLKIIFIIMLTTIGLLATIYQRI